MSYVLTASHSANILQARNPRDRMIQHILTLWTLGWKVAETTSGWQHSFLPSHLTSQTQRLWVWDYNSVECQQAWYNQPGICHFVDCPPFKIINFATFAIYMYVRLWQFGVQNPRMHCTHRNTKMAYVTYLACYYCSGGEYCLMLWLETHMCLQ